MRTFQRLLVIRGVYMWKYDFSICWRNWSHLPGTPFHLNYLLYLGILDQSNGSKIKHFASAALHAYLLLSQVLFAISDTFCRQ